MNKKRKRKLRKRFSSGLKSFAMLISTLEEWRDAKHRDPSREGIVLSGTVWIDETYFPKWRSETELSGGKGPRGLSRNQLCVAAMTDGKVCVLVLCGVGRPSMRQVLKAYARTSRGARGSSMTATPPTTPS